MMKHQVEPPQALKEASLGKEFPRDLEKIVAGRVAKNPDDRYQNLLLVGHDLKLLKRGESLDDTAPVVRPEPVARAARRRARPAVLARSVQPPDR